MSPAKSGELEGLVAKIVAYSGTDMHVHIATEVLETLHPGATGLCFIIKVWLVTFTDENTLASNRQHALRSEGIMSIE